MAIERLGELLLLEKLAAGGMAEVFRARQFGASGFEKTVAVKRILPHFTSTEAFRAMFRAEANLSAMLQHANIAQVFSNGEQDEYLYLVMELVDGKNLRQLLVKSQEQNRPLPIEYVCFIICEAAKGLDYAHEFHDEKSGEPLHIVHRDVNHQNILVSYEGNVKIVDFGVAKAAANSQNTRAGVLKGKIAYMSPEQARGQKIDKRSDVFSLGIVLWELLVGQTLFVEEDELMSLEKVRACVIPSVSGLNAAVPLQLENILLRSLQRDPNERYASARELYAALMSFLNERYPQFLPSDIGVFMRDLFKTEIAEDRRRREKVNAEAKEYLVRNPILRNTGPRILFEESKTKVSDLDQREPKTLVSRALDAGSQNISGVIATKSTGSWQLSESGFSMPKIEFESAVMNSDSSRHNKKLVALLVVVLLCVVGYWIREREQGLLAIDTTSRYDPWSETFKASFIKRCTTDAPPEHLEEYRKFCDCLSTEIERARVLPTRYNPQILTEEQFADQNSERLKNYLRSDQSQSARMTCEATIPREISTEIQY